MRRPRVVPSLSLSLDHASSSSTTHNAQLTAATAVLNQKEEEKKTIRVESRSAVTGWLTADVYGVRYDAQCREMMRNSCVIIKVTSYVDCCKHSCISCFIIAIIGQRNMTKTLNASSVGNATKAFLHHFHSLASAAAAAAAAAAVVYSICSSCVLKHSNIVLTHWMAHGDVRLYMCWCF